MEEILLSNPNREHVDTYKESIIDQLDFKKLTLYTAWRWKIPNWHTTDVDSTTNTHVLG